MSITFFAAMSYAHLARGAVAARVPVPGIKPALVQVRLDNPLNERLMHACVQVHAKQTGERPWMAKLQAVDGVPTAQIKAADVRAVFGNPQQAVQSLFGPMMRIASSAMRGMPTHDQLPHITQIRSGESLDEVAARTDVRAAPYMQSTPQDAQSFLGALLEASVHSQVDEALRAIGQGPVTVSLASKESLIKKLHSNGNGSNGYVPSHADPAVFLDVSMTWPQLMPVAGGVLGSHWDRSAKTQRVTAYLRTSVSEGPLDLLLKGGVKPHEVVVKTTAQRDNTVRWH